MRLRVISTYWRATKAETIKKRHLGWKAANMYPIWYHHTPVNKISTKTQNSLFPFLVRIAADKTTIIYALYEQILPWNANEMGPQTLTWVWRFLKWCVQICPKLSLVYGLLVKVVIVVVELGDVIVSNGDQRELNPESYLATNCYFSGVVPSERRLYPHPQVFNSNWECVQQRSPPCCRNHEDGHCNLVSFEWYWAVRWFYRWFKAKN